MIKNKSGTTILLTDHDHAQRAGDLLAAAVTILHAAEEQLSFTDNLRNCGSYCDKIAAARANAETVMRKLRVPPPDDRGSR